MSNKTARRSRADALAWMRAGTCLGFGDLPWIADPEQTTARERVVMGSLCHDCPVVTDCAAYVTREKVTAGFWAGKNRDLDTSSVMTGPRWAIDPLPGLGSLNDFRGLGGAA